MRATLRDRSGSDPEAWAGEDFHIGVGRVRWKYDSEEERAHRHSGLFRENRRWPISNTLAQSLRFFVSPPPSSLSLTVAALHIVAVFALVIVTAGFTDTVTV